MIQELSSGSLVTSLTITGLFVMRDLPNLTESLKRTLKRISNVLFNLVWLDLVKSTFLPRYFSLRSKRPSPWWAFLTTLLWELVMFLLDIATSVWHEHAGHSYLRDCWKTFWGPMLFLKKKKNSSSCTTLKNTDGHNELVHRYHTHSSGRSLFWETDGKQPYLPLKGTHSSSDVSADTLSWLSLRPEERLRDQKHDISASAVWAGKFDGLHRRDRVTLGVC